MKAAFELLAIIIASASLFTLAMASVALQDANGITLAVVDDLPAAFGPELPDTPVSGFLVVADPPGACTAIARPSFLPSGSTWIALIARTNSTNEICNFAVKVQNAQDAGASAAIVYDNIEEPLVTMGSTGGDPTPAISSVFISNASGTLILQNYYPGESHVLVATNVQIYWTSFALYAVAGTGAFIFVIGAFYFIRRPWRRRSTTAPVIPLAEINTQAANSQFCMSKDDLDKLPIFTHDGPAPDDDDAVPVQEVPQIPVEPGGVHSEDVSRTAGDTARVCTICLEQYKVGDELRLLPCGHRYHRECIDPWLLNRKAVCPVCKMPLKTVSVVEPPSPQGPADVEAGIASAGADSSAVPAEPVALPQPDRRWFGRWRLRRQHAPPMPQP